MKKFYTRKNLRLPAYNYTSPGYYFVTICTHKQKRLLGQIIHTEGGSRAAPTVKGSSYNQNTNKNIVGGVRERPSRMCLNQIGKIAQESWLWLEQQYDHVSLDWFVIMPNHIHGIIIIKEGGSRAAPTKPLGQLIGAFKTISTKQINILRNTPGTKIWQRNYYEHVIRNEESLQKIREYIVNNPQKWHMDEYCRN